MNSNEINLHPLIKASKLDGENAMIVRLSDYEHMIICKNVQGDNLKEVYRLLVDNFNQKEYVIMSYWISSKKGLHVHFKYLQDIRFPNECYIDWVELNKEESKMLSNKFGLSYNANRGTSHWGGIILKFKNSEDAMLTTVLGIGQGYKRR